MWSTWMRRPAIFRRSRPDGQVLVYLPHAATNASGIAVGPDGRIWIADTAGGRVLRLTAAGQLEATFLAGSRARTTVSSSRWTWRSRPTARPTSWTCAGGSCGWTRRPGGGRVAGGMGRRPRRQPPGHRQTGSSCTDPDRQRLDILDPATGGSAISARRAPRPASSACPSASPPGPMGKLYVVDSDNARVQVLRLP